jgi:hypothetical protein
MASSEKGKKSLKKNGPEEKNRIFKAEPDGQEEIGEPFRLPSPFADFGPKSSQKHEKRILEEEKDRRTKAMIKSLVEKTILEKFAPPGVLMDERMDVLYFYGKTRKFLSPPEGDPSFNLSRMTPRGVHEPIQSALETQKEIKRPLVFKDIRLRENDHFFLCDLLFTPLA